MPNVRISDAADAGTLLASDMLPLARSGNTNAYHATMTEIAAFASTSLASGAYGNVGRNLCHNPLFNVVQRGVGPFTVAGSYTLDRWNVSAILDTFSISQVAHTDVTRAQIGDEAAQFALDNTFTGNAGAGATTVIIHSIENVRRLSGKTVTVSFYAADASGTLKFGCSVDQDFGTGGSPSAAVTGNGQSVTLTTTWTRYSLTFTLPSVSGKTLGTNNNDNTALNFWYSAGANFATRAGNIGVQSGTVGIWGVQLEVGSVATPLEKPDPRYDLANCQRFYQIVYLSVRGPASAAGQSFDSTVVFQPMRALPTSTPTGFGIGNNLSSATPLVASYNSARFEAVSAAAGDTYALNYGYSLSADF